METTMKIVRIPEPIEIDELMRREPVYLPQRRGAKWVSLAVQFVVALLIALYALAAAYAALWIAKVIF
jgi:hypothetical protein